MPQDQVMPKTLVRRGPRGIRRLVYGCGRALQGLGLILIWWVLLLFAGVADMWVLLYWSLAAALVFYVGWLGVQWGHRGDHIDETREVQG